MHVSLSIHESMYTSKGTRDSARYFFSHVSYTHKTRGNEELRMCVARACYLQVNEISFSG